MATDTLEIFGDEFSGVTGFKATDDNGNTKTYIRPDGNVNISQAGVTDVTNYATAYVPELEYTAHNSITYRTANNQRKCDIDAWSTIDTAGFAGVGTIVAMEDVLNAVPANTTITPTTSAQTIGGANYMMEGAVTVAAVSQTNLTAANIKSGTTVTISNGQSNLWSVTGTYSGGGGSLNVKQTTWTNNSTSTVSHQFTGLSGTPKFAVLRCTSQLTRSSSNTYYYIADIIWDGTDAWGNYHLRSNGTYNDVSKTAASGFNVTVGTNSITFSSDSTSRSSAPGSFFNGTYELTYVY